MERVGDDPELPLGLVDVDVELVVLLCAVLLLVAVRASQYVVQIGFSSSSVTSIGKVQI